MVTDDLARAERERAKAKAQATAKAKAAEKVRALRKCTQPVFAAGSCACGICRWFVVYTCNGIYCYTFV